MIRVSEFFVSSFCYDTGFWFFLFPASVMIRVVAPFTFLAPLAIWSDMLPLLFIVSPRYLYVRTPSSVSPLSFRALFVPLPFITIVHLANPNWMWYLFFACFFYLYMISRLEFMMLLVCPGDNWKGHIFSEPLPTPTSTAIPPVVFDVNRCVLVCVCVCVCVGGGGCVCGGGVWGGGGGGGGGGGHLIYVRTSIERPLTVACHFKYAVLCSGIPRKSRHGAIYFHFWC